MYDTTSLVVEVTVQNDAEAEKNLNIGRGKGGAIWLQPHPNLNVLHMILNFAIENYSQLVPSDLGTLFHHCLIISNFKKTF